MAEKEVVVFRSKSRNHRIHSGGLQVRFVAHTYRTDVPGEIALLRERCSAANSMITEIKPEDRVTLKIEKAPAGVSKAAAKNAKVDPQALDVPGAAEPKK